jgi:hypothetical protein
MIGLAMAALALSMTPAVASADDPYITRDPALSGSSLVGGRLNAVGATWRGWPSVSVGWAWLRCDSDSLWSCKVIDGARTTSYTVSSADLGKRLRALLWISNRDGQDYAVTPSSAVVAMPPPPVVTPAPVPVPQPAPPPPVVATPVLPPVTPEVTTPKLMRPEPVVRVRGWLTLRGARITLLTVRAPRAARIAVSCSGIGCPRVAKSAKRTRLRKYEGMYRAGARIVIRVTRPGFIGKHTLIRIRHRKAPVRFDRCLYPGSGAPKACRPA